MEKSKEKEAARKRRDKRIVGMHNKGYPVTYIAEVYGITKARVSQIIKTSKEEEHANK